MQKEPLRELVKQQLESQKEDLSDSVEKLFQNFDTSDPYHEFALRKEVEKIIKAKLVKQALKVIQEEKKHRLAQKQVLDHEKQFIVK